MAIIQEFDLNLIPDSEAVIVKVSQYDDGTARLKARLYENELAYTPASGATARIEGTKPDKHGFSYVASISGNLVTADLTTQMTAVAGRVPTQIVITEPSGQTGTFVFWLDVQKAALSDDTDISDTELPAIMDLARENARKAEEAAENAEASAEGAAQSAQDASDSASAAAQSASNASSAASTATSKAGEAAASATAAAGSATAASGSATTASDYATQAKSWAVGPNGTGTSGTDTNNSKYWAEQAAQSASEAEQYAQGGLIYKGSILFANIPTTNLKAGDMYNIEDDFTTDSRFQEGAGKSVKAGTNIAWNGTKWDLLAAGGGSEIQVMTMPAAGSAYQDRIVQFIGASAGNYTNGYFYKCNGVSGAPLSYDFYLGSVVFYNNEIHILGGQGNATGHYKWNGRSWVSVSTLPYNFKKGAAVVYNDEIHILGAYGDTVDRYHYKWDGSSWTSVSTLPYQFSEGSAIVYNNEIHILGGNTNNFHYKYDGTSWTSVSTLPLNFLQGSAVVYDNEIHILGGLIAPKSHYKYNGSTWVEASSLPYNFYNSSAVVYENEIHILDSDNSSDKKKHYKWDGTSWTSVSTLPYWSCEGSAVVVDSKIHILGGAYGRTNHYAWNGTDWISLMESSYSWVRTDVQPSGGSGGGIPSGGTTGQVLTKQSDADGDVDWRDASGGASESEIAPVEATSTASKAYAINDLLIYNGHLYRVTAAIANGGTITPGTNATETSVSEVFVRKTGDTMTGQLKTTRLTVGATMAGYGPDGSNAATFGSYTKAISSNQLVAGRFNNNSVDNVFELGNGSSRGSESNAFEVSWTGDVKAAGDITDGQGNTLKGANGNLATIETTTTASQAYAVGDYLVYGGQLYKVTTAIASGGTITTTGSSANVAATTVILAINDMVGLALTASY